MVGRTLPNWLVQPGRVLLGRFVKNIHDLLVDQVELLDANPNFANVGLKSGNEVTVSVSDLIPCPSTPIQTSGKRKNVNNFTESFPNEKTPVFDVFKTPPLPEQTAQNLPAKLSTPNTASTIPPVSKDVSLGQFLRIRKAPDRFENNIYNT